MQSVSSCFFLLIWLCVSAVVKAQNGCPGSSIPTDGNNDLPSEIKDTYKDGESLRLSCKSGYAGFLRIICSKDVWRKSGPRRCNPKQCGHPGDTPNGDFLLTRGEDFVFGSQVQYSCKKGYVLAGKTNHRNCMDQGWDNIVPVCEVVKCEPIQQTGDLVASGNTESPQYGDIIQFECQTDVTRIKGEKQIYCTDKGEWSKPLPECEEITCNLPAIPHGEITNQQTIYRKDDILTFSCEKRYRPVERASTQCTIRGWSRTPRCEEIHCKVDTSSDIQDKTRAAFYPEETAEVVCKRSFRTKTKKQQDTVTCTENGWSFLPFCEEIECRLAQEPNVNWVRNYYQRFHHKEIVTRTSFSCRQGYRESHRSVCEIGGWVPPLCEAITCEPEIPNAVILSAIRKYTISERLEYKCLPFHEPEGRQVTHCTENGWSNKHQCRAIIGFCPRPDLKNGYLISHESNPSVIYYGCLPGFKPSVEGWWGELTCRGKKWPQLPKCIGKMKCIASTISNAKWKEKEEEYSNGDVLTYECDVGYEMESNDRIKCINGRWESPLPVCKPSPYMCNPPPHVEHATITSTYKTTYIHSSKVQYKCKELYELHGNSEVTCRYGTWSTIPNCIRSECVSPNDKIKNAVIAYKKVGPYKNGTEVDYQCEDKFHSEGQTKAICINGDWHYPHCIGVQPKCEDPPILKNGYIIKREEKDGGTEVTYECKHGYKLKNDTKVKCLQGEWKPLPVCLSNECSIAREPNVIWSYYSGSFRHKETVTSPNFRCKEGYRPSHESMCDVGGWVPPLCEAMTCEPEIPNAVIMSEIRKYTIRERLEYKCLPFHEPEGKQATYCTKNGWYNRHQCRAMKSFCQRPDFKNGYLISHGSNPSVIYYGCLPGFKPSVEGWWGELTCRGETWPQLPKCIGIMKCIAPTISNAKWTVKEEEYSNGDVLTYECDEGYKMESNNRTTCINGSWESPLPFCKPSPDMCSPPPHVEYATITSTYKTKYINSSKVQYKCKELYELHGNSEVTCRYGTWSTIPKCIRSECVSPDDKIKNAVIAYKKVGPYKNGTEVDYRCEDKFHSEGRTKAICINGDWHYPHCIAKDYCEKPDLTDGFVKFFGEGVFSEGAILDYECYQPCKRKTDERLICKNGRWDPPAECICTQLKCEDPPIPENGDIIKIEEKDGGTEVTYQCKLGYKLKNDTKVKCLQGEWKPLPVCLRPCVIETIDPKYNLQNPSTKTYLPQGEKKTIYCKRDHWYLEYGQYWSAIEVVCQDGEIEYKSCQRY